MDESSDRVKILLDHFIRMETNEVKNKLGQWLILKAFQVIMIPINRINAVVQSTTHDLKSWLIGIILPPKHILCSINSTSMSIGSSLQPGYDDVAFPNDVEFSVVIVSNHDDYQLFDDDVVILIYHFCGSCASLEYTKNILQDIIKKPVSKGIIDIVDLILTTKDEHEMRLEKIEMFEK